jgi:primosomal protein N' (replication factor Y)
LLVHGGERSNLQAFLRQMIATAANPRGSVRVSVDIDPQSFL